MASRWKKHLVGWSVVVVVVGAFVVLYFPKLHWGLMGLARGDSFFHGMPTSYWRFELESSIDERGRAARELELGREAALPVVLEILRKKQSFTRVEAAHILERLGPAAKEAVPDLQDMLEDEDGLVRGAGFRVLNRIAPEAIPVGWRLQPGR